VLSKLVDYEGFANAITNIPTKQIAIQISSVDFGFS
jgi:hypothetical protein